MPYVNDIYKTSSVRKLLNKRNKKKSSKIKKVQKKTSFCTSLETYHVPKYKRKYVEHYSYNLLNESHKEWILEKYIYLIEHLTEHEQMFENILIRNNIKYDKQVFFKINDNNYFLDFYLPTLHIAIEIDGSSHKHQKKYDKDRDKLFSYIGIKTIRISNANVNNININSLLYKE